MNNNWSPQEAERWVKDFGAPYGKDVALQAYASSLLGKEPDLVLYGGGNTSVKAQARALDGAKIQVLFVKASGQDMAAMRDPSGMVCMRMDGLLKLKKIRSMSDEVMADQYRLLLARPHAHLPSIETLLHAFLPAPYVTHTHPAAILALTNRQDARVALRKAFQGKVVTVAYTRAGLELAHAVDKAYRKNPRAEAIILLQHGLITWGKTAKEAYEKTLAAVQKAEDYLAAHVSRKLKFVSAIAPGAARQRFVQAAPVLRGLLCPASADPDRRFQRMILRPLLQEPVLRFVSSHQAKGLAMSAPLTPDYLIRTKALPLWLEEISESPETLRRETSFVIETYAKKYAAQARQHGASIADALPRVVFLKGLGAACAGKTPADARIAEGITAQAIRVKTAIYETGGQYLGLPAGHLSDMEFRAMQQAKTARHARLALSGSIALVTGAAGAIGSGICRSLLQAGCAVALADLPGKGLENASAHWEKSYPGQTLALSMDVTDTASVSRGFDELIAQFGGVDLVVVNAGIAHVAPLSELAMDQFRLLERVNVEGTLAVIAEAAKRFRLQNMGGDIVLISTKNVFAPGASFGAYSATKAAAHQLARIASLELAPLDVRVNMVAPDAVFSDGKIKSGLWAKVGPERMKARGLDQKGLEDYYRDRNLLKARVTADHVGRAVLFFATRQTPTTGATLPVDGGLPDATPR